MSDHDHDHSHDHSHGHRHEGPVAWDGVTVPAGGGAGATVAWFHCFSGIAGDMALGALIDAGADVDEVRTMLKRLPVDGWDLETESVLRSGIAGTKVHVRTEADPPSRTAAEVAAIVAAAELPDRVHRRALATFRALAEAEGRLHRQPPGDRALPRGRRPRRHRRRGRHLRRARGARRRRGHLARRWPTASARCGPPTASSPCPCPPSSPCSRGPRPTGSTSPASSPPRPAPRCSPPTSWSGARCRPWSCPRAGFGAGTADLGDRPNLTRVVIGTRSDAAGRVPGQPVVLLEANVDDVTGEALAFAVDSLLAAGAHDAWVTPIVMKKGRPAHTVSVLADPSLAAEVAGRAGPRDRHAWASGARPSSAGPRAARSTRSPSTGRSSPSRSPAAG